MHNFANDYGYGETNLTMLLGLAFPESDGVTMATSRATCARSRTTAIGLLRDRRTAIFHYRGLGSSSHRHTQQAALSDTRGPD